MGIWGIRAFFALVMGGLGWQVARLFDPPFDPFWGIIAAEVLYLLVMTAEVLLAKGSPTGFAALLMGVLMGFILARLIYTITTLTVGDLGPNEKPIQLILTAICCYLCIAVIFKTREQFRFIIPYVEFRRQYRGPQVMLLDSSAIIDGRLADLYRAGAFDSPVLVPSFVLRELQAVADSSDRQKRRRGRRGLDLLNKLQQDPRVGVEIYHALEVPGKPVDARLLDLARELGAKLVTCDANLQKLAELQSVAVINLNELANALKPLVLPGETITIEVLRRGEEPDQGVGFLEDGTMVVVEHGSSHVGNEVSVEVTRTIQTPSGKLIFGRVTEKPPG